MMKRVLQWFTIVIGVFVLLLIILVFLEGIRLKWWDEREVVSLDELTPEQKVEDMHYLLELTQKVTPAEVVWEAAGLDNPLRQVDVWLERARQTSSNSEFADLILQYLVHLGQGGHAFLAYDVNYNPVTSLISDIPRDAFSKMPRWAAIINQLQWNAHSNLDIIYQQGLYVLNKDANINNIPISAGAVVEKVDGVNVDEFVLQQQYRAHLRYDPHLHKFYLYPLLVVDPGRSSWLVTFRLPDQEELTVQVQKIPGYLPHRPDESHEANTRCLSLREDVLYIKVSTFYRQYVEQDAATLHTCFNSGLFQNVIFDVRGNNGGEIWSYMDNIIAPLINQPITYQSTVANRESFYAWHGWRFLLYQFENDNQLTDARAHVSQVTQINYPPYSDQGWRVMRITRRIEPSKQPFPFNGRVYVLADNNTLSAGDSFVSTVQQIGLAKVIGVNTVGWGQAAQAKMLYALPNSGLLFYVDSELIFNPDGSLNNYMGVMPDVFLSDSIYPTPYPSGFTREGLLKDAWVQWILEEITRNKMELTNVKMIVNQ